MSDTKGLPVAVSVRGPPLPPVRLARLMRLYVSRRPDGSLIVERDADDLVDGVRVALKRPWPAINAFLVGWTATMCSLGAITGFDGALMFPLAVLSGPAGVQTVLHYTRDGSSAPRRRICLHLRPDGWTAGGPLVDGVVPLRRSLARTARMFWKASGERGVCVREPGHKRMIVASNLPLDDAGYLVDLLRDYGRHG